MAPAGKSTTPGRRKQTGNQYFDVGRVGRKTGITLKDTGIRDEHGLEPVSGIFSSPDEPEQNGSRTLTSEGMDLDDGKLEAGRGTGGYQGHALTAAGSAPDITQTLTGRKVHMPPPRQTTPRHTNIGSPKRMSSARPTSRSAADAGSSQPLTNAPANRRLDFQGTNRNRKSINVVEGSPFKPKKVLRRSDGPARRSIYEQVDEEEEEEQEKEAAIEPTNAEVEDDSIEQSIEDNGPIMMDDDVHGVEEDESAISVAETQAPAKRKPGRPRKSDQSNTSLMQNTPQVAKMGSASKKRWRTSLNESENSISQPQVEASGSRPKKSRVSNAGSVSVHRDSNSGNEDVYPIEVDDYNEETQPEDEEVDAQLESQLQEEPEPQPKGKGRPKGKGKKAAAPKERDANRAMQKKGSPVKLNDSPSKRHRGGSAGPVSNVQLRATTPFDDANQTTSRSGRNLIQPLKFWQNESLIWKAGEIEGIIRADPVDTSKATSKRRRKGKKTKRSKLSAIEESDTESILPDEWEEEMGVITGNIAAWNPLTKTADPGDPMQEDIAFAASSIVTRDVPDSQFKYAKIMTIPFFGAGVVELPPGGFKRAKNSRKMQMVFFVHEGKVLVEVGATGLEVNEFALSKGGCWVVPRGNNYAITNESETRAAKVFFAQGCVVDSTADEEEQRKKDKAAASRS